MNRLRESWFDVEIKAFWFSAMGSFFALRTMRNGATRVALCVCVVAPLSMAAQRLPQSEAVTLDGVRVRLPELFLSRPAIVVLTFSKKASADARLWGQGLYAENQLKRGDCVYGMFMVERVPRQLRGFVERSISNELPTGVRSHYIAVEDHEQLWKNLVHATSPDDVYVIVVDSCGSVVWQTHSQFSAEGLALAEDAFRNADRNVREAINSSQLPVSSLASGPLPTRRSR